MNPLLSRLRRDQDLSTLLVLGAFLFLVVAPVFFGGPFPVRGDKIDALTEYAFLFPYRDAFSRFGEIPYWNPYMGGGIPFLGNHGFRGFSLWWVFTNAFGETGAVKAMIATLFLFGSAGMFLFCRRLLKASIFASVIGTLTYSCASWYAARVVEGNYSELCYFLLPLFLYGVDLAKQKWSWLFLPIIVLHFLITEGRFAPFSFVLVACAIVLMSTQNSWKDRLQSIGVVGVSSAVAILLMMPKLLALFDTLSRSAIGAETLRVNAISLGFLVRGFFPWSLDAGAVGLGFPLAFAAVAGFVVGGRRLIPYLVVGLVSLLLCLGDNSPVPILALTRKLPLLDKMGAVGKHMNIQVLFCLAVGVVAFADWVIFQARIPRLRAAILGGLIGVTAPQVFLTAKTLTGLFGNPPVPVTAREVEFYQVSAIPLIDEGTRYRRPTERNVLADTYFNERRNIGTITFYGTSLLPENAVPRYFVTEQGRRANAEYIAEAYFLDESGAKHPQKLELSYNELKVSLGSKAKPGVLVVNQNYHPGWKSSVGTVVNHKGLLGVALSSHVSSVQLRYRPNALLFGMPCLLLGLVLLGGTFVLRER